MTKKDKKEQTTIALAEGNILSAALEIKGKEVKQHLKKLEKMGYGKS